MRFARRTDKGQRMKVKELIDKLKKLDQEKEIMRSAWEFSTFHEIEIREATADRIIDEDSGEEWRTSLCSWMKSLEKKEIYEI